MTKTGISRSIWNRFSRDNVIECAKNGYGMQISFFKPEDFNTYFESTIEELLSLGLEDKILCIHLPMSAHWLAVYDKNFLEIIKRQGAKFDDWSMNYVIHPNKLIIEALDLLQNSGIKQWFCIENFLSRRKKVLRTPFDIIIEIVERRVRKQDSNLRLCLDTSHSEPSVLVDPGISTILRYTNVIHLSNKKWMMDEKKGCERTIDHLPFNTPGAEHNLVGFVRDLKRRYMWEGIIVLEYNGDNRHKLFKNLAYLNTLLGKK